ncbi:signal peptidase I [Nocardioides sp. Root140]|uniref:signal peptidase I n=1 Tax=Nocardioides sp. Root140 TaxID=1736460 RepID=UPI0009E7BE5B|nr:signal peptidase I [Nocardioides sp. Root140]
MSARTTWAGRLRESALWLGAGLGVLCLVLGALALVLDVRPLVFRSGSMSPGIESGALALARDVPASELEVGDVVSVMSGRNVRITHRIVSIDRTEDGTVLHLKGDANAAPDAEAYPVDSAYRVFADVPWAGHVVNAASTPWGLLVCGGFVTFLLVSAFGRGRREKDDGDSDGAGDGGGTRIGGVRKKPRRSVRRATRRAAAVSTTGMLVAGGVCLAPISTMATFSDTAVVTGGSLTALTVPAPTAPVCTPGVNATVSWTSAGPNYSYYVTATRVSDGAVAYSGFQTSTSITFTTGLLGNLLSTNFVARIRAVPTGTNAWLSSGSITSNFRTRTLGLGTDCGHF